MAKTYRPYVPEQDLLLPPSLREWLPEDYLAFFVSDLIDQLDLTAITNVYEDEERGYPPYHPVMLTKVLVYAYCIGVFSSRKIQRRLICTRQPLHWAATKIATSVSSRRSLKCSFRTGSASMGRNLLEPVQPLPVFNYLNPIWEAEEDLVDQIFTSSNPLISWLRQLEGLRNAA